MDFEMDMDIIPGEMDKHQLCHKCNGDKPWSPVRLERKNLVIQDVVFGIGQKDPSIYLIHSG